MTEQHLDVYIQAPSDAYRLQTYVNWERRDPAKFRTIDPLTLVRTLRLTIVEDLLAGRMAQFVPTMASEYLALEVFHLRVEGWSMRHTIVSDVGPD